MVQWLKLCTSNAQGTGSIPGQGTRSHMLHCVAKKRELNQLKLKKKKYQNQNAL